ncbi:DUF58 domain-containing protein [Candidatus Peregrinibacteria bacterium]|nr:MAG: DUF58 domain-containing protein [Candidatus Peregrinibacteria bacterium]
MKKVRRLEIRTQRDVTGIFAGNYRSSFRGTGVEYEDVREYQEGDDVRSIDWGVTAREGKPFIKLYREEREMNTFLVLDTSANMNFGTTKRLKKETALEAMALLAFSVFRSSDRLGAFFFQKDAPLFFPSKKGKGNMLRILQKAMLATNEQNSVQTPSGAETLQSFSKLSKKKRGICFFLSDRIPQESEKEILLLNQRYDFVFLRCTDPFEMHPKSTGIFPFFDTESRQVQSGGGQIFWKNYASAQEEEEQRLQSFLKRGKIDTLTISTEENIAEKLFSFFKARQRKFSF